MIIEKFKVSWDFEVDIFLFEEDFVNIEYRVLFGEYIQYMFCFRFFIDGGNR